MREVRISPGVSCGSLLKGAEMRKDRATISRHVSLAAREAGGLTGEHGAREEHGATVQPHERGWATMRLAARLKGANSRMDIALKAERTARSGGSADDRYTRTLAVVTGGM